LTEYNIEGRLGKGSSTALASHHSMAMPSAVAVERATVIIGALASSPNNARGVAELARCNASDNTSSASDIQNAIPLTQSSGLYQLVRPGSENDRDQVTLVVFRHTCKEVPATRTSCEPSSPMRISRTSPFVQRSRPSATRRLKSLSSATSPVRRWAVQSAKRVRVRAPPRLLKYRLDWRLLLTRVA